MSIYGTATVLKNFEIAQGIWQMELFAPQIATVASPGQFINLYPNDSTLLLPRPISLSAILTEEIQIIYRVVGHGTRQFSNLQSGEEIKILLKSILRVVKEVERYLLNVNCILMDPEYIFYTEEKYYFCYYPPKEKSLWEGFHHLSEYLVKCADYQDKECVQIVFLLHKETMKENYSLEQIIKECVKEEEENVLAEDKNTDLGTEEEKEGSTYFDRTEHDWIASQEMGSTILRETENLWTPMKRFLHRRRKPKWGDWDGLYIEEEDL